MQGIYECRHAIPLSECDANKMWRLDSIYSSMQTSSNQHSVLMNVSRETLIEKFNVAWMLLGMRVIVDRYPCCGEDVTIRTWPGINKNITYPRYYEIFDSNSKKIAYAASSWGLVDMGLRKLMLPRSAKGMIPNFSDIKREPPLQEPRRLHSAEPEGKEFIFSPCISDIDENGHVNNIRYVKLVTDILESKNRSIKDISLFYISEIILGQHIRLFVREDNRGFVIHSEDAETGRDVFEAYGLWEHSDI